MAWDAWCVIRTKNRCVQTLDDKEMIDSLREMGSGQTENYKEWERVEGEHRRNKRTI